MFLDKLTNIIIKIFKDKKLIGKDVWFTTHQILMVSALVFSILGMIPIIIDKGLDPIKEKVSHSLVGVAALVLAFLQPLLAMARCSPSHSLRPLFNWTHGIIGFSILALSWTSVFLTTKMQTQVVPEHFEYHLFAILAWVTACHVLVNIYAKVTAGEAKKDLRDDKKLNIFGEKEQESYY